MYEMVIINRFGKLSIMRGDNLEELKKVAKRLNEKGCDIEIIETVRKVLYRRVSLNNK